MTTKRFIVVYDWIIDFAAKRDARFVNVYATSLVAYMNRAAASAWKDLALEKKAGIRAKVMVWKDLPISAEFGLKEKCEEFLEKYKMW